MEQMLAARTRPIEAEVEGCRVTHDRGVSGVGMIQVQDMSELMGEGPVKECLFELQGWPQEDHGSPTVTRRHDPKGSSVLGILRQHDPCAPAFARREGAADEL